MIVKYAGNAFSDNEAMVSFFGPVRAYGPRGRTQFVTKRMVIQGEIIAATPALIDARVSQIQSMFALEGGTAVLCQSDGTETQIKLDSSAVSGVRIIEGPSFAMQDGKAHYATGLPFTIALEADYLVSDGDALVTWRESVTRIGNGGPRTVTVELDNGGPVRQIVSNSTPVIIIQAGEAVGSAAYPAFPNSYFPGYLDVAQSAETMDTPELNGLGFMNYPIRWHLFHTLDYNPGRVAPVPR